MTTDQMDAPDGAQFEDERWGPVETATDTPSISYVNEHFERDEEMEALFEGTAGRHARREIASVIEKWSQSLAGVHRTATLDVFNRHRWEGANHTHAIMSQCAWAVENDDILSTLADVLEGLMWQKCRFELFDDDQQDMWNQWAADVNLDACLRQMGREEFKVSQFYVGLWWEQRVYEVQDDSIEETIKEFERKREELEHEKKVKARDEYIAMFSGTEGYIEPPEVPDLDKSGPGRGNRKRRKKFPVVVPTEMTIFDPTKVVPVGTLMFGRERFAYVADRGEDEAFSTVLSGEVVDDTVLRLIERKYVPTAADKQHCAEIGVDPNRLWLFRKDAVFRHTATKAEYERYASVRLKPALEILEMKQHLRASDRATLIGSTNFIVVITKGTDKLPAKPAEIANLQEQARVIARMPVLIGDHRLNVEIVAPKLDHTLQQSRWEVLDSRLVFKALQSYAPVVQGGNSSGTGVSEMSRVIAKGLESRRHMILRSLEKHVFREILRRNEGTDLEEFPSLAFTPKRISLDFNSDIIGQILKLRDRGDISRETTLEELDFDQDVEVVRRANERVVYDRVFESQTPFSSPTQNPYGVSQPPPGQPPGTPPGAPANNIGPNGQPRTEGGRPSGAKDEEKRQPARRGGGRS
jgi:hypothetical protein